MTDQLFFAGVILAGGKSRRMGRDKADLVLNSDTLLDHAVDLARQSGATPVVVSGPRPRYHGIPDRWPDLGPVGGLASVLDSHPTLVGRVLLIIPVDLPFLSPITLRKLVRVAMHERTAAHFFNEPLPLALRITSVLASWLRNFCRNMTTLSMRDLAGHAGAIEIRDPGIGIELTNINTPEQWRNARKVLLSNANARLAQNILKSRT